MTDKERSFQGIDRLQQQLDLDTLYKSFQTLQILVCGQTASGKSTLINSFFGRKVVEVNDPGLEGGDLSAGTTKVESYRLGLGETSVDIFDSPGLQSDEEPSVLEEYLQDTYEKCKDVDLFLYCFAMSSDRFTRDDITTLEKFNKRFGESFWKRCVLVLTKTNLVHIPVRYKGKEREYHQRLYQTMLSKFREELGKLGVSSSIINAIPACAAGLAYCDVEEEADEEMDEERFVWYPSDKAEPSDRPVDFLGELWVTSIERMPAGPSRDKLMKGVDTTNTESSEILQANEIMCKEHEELIRRKLEQDIKELKRKYDAGLVRLRDLVRDEIEGMRAALEQDVRKIVEQIMKEQN